MQKNYKNGIISGNTIRFGGYNKKTNRNFFIDGDEKIKINKLNINNNKYSNKKYKFTYDNDNDNDINNEIDDNE